MKIGIVCPYNLFRPGGVQEHVLAQQRYFTDRGHEVVLITPQPRSFKDSAPAGMIFMGQSTKINAPQNTTLEVSAAADLSAIDTMFEKEQFDIVQFHEPLVPLMPRQLLGRCTAIKIGTFHAAMPDTVMSKSIAGSVGLYFKSVAKQLDAVTAVSPAATDYIGQYIDLPVEFIPNGIDLKQYIRDHNIPRSKSTILFVGRLEKRKGVAYLIKAMAELQKTMPHTQLVIAGDGPDREKLEQLVLNLNVQHVKFLGFISNEEKMKLMQECAVFCAPALYGESFGIVVLEAMTMGAPVVAGDNPGYAFLLQERGMSGLVNPKDSIDFARRLRLFLTDEELRNLWVNWAEEYTKKFAYDKIIDQYETLFDKLIETKKHSF